MYEKVLIFLDGSEQSELILPYVEELSRNFDSQIDVVSVCSLQHEHPFERLLRRYLDEIVNQLKDRGLLAKAVLLRGNPAEVILNYANETNASLIAMRTYRRSGISTWVGSIAEKVLRGAVKPLLLISEKRQAVKFAEKPKFGKILVPLDGSNLGAAALPWVKELALRVDAQLLLLHIILFDFKVGGALNQAVSFQEQLVEALRKQAQEYMVSVVDELGKEKIKCKYDIVMGVPQDSIIEYAKRNAVDLIAMSTHGRTGLGRYVLGSVADKVVHASDLPVLMVRAHGQ